MNNKHPYESVPLDVLCVGMAAYDLVFAIPRHIEADEKGSASSLLTSGGGPAANAAVGVARLTLRSAFSGALGRDAFGEAHLAELQVQRVDTRFVQRSGARTPLSIIFVKPDGKRSIVNYREAEPLAADSFDFSTISPKVVLFDGHEPELSTTLIPLAEDWGAKTVLDAGSVHRGTRALAPVVDYLVCSQKFALEFTETNQPAEALDALSRTAKCVVVTLGAKGLIWKCTQGEGALPAYPTSVVDTTGAGDAFHAAFAACLVWKYDWSSTLRFASAAAAMCCMKMGARPGLPTKDAVDRFLSDT